MRVFDDLELLRDVLRCAIERQLHFPAGMNKVYCYCCCCYYCRHTATEERTLLQSECPQTAMGVEKCAMIHSQNVLKQLQELNSAQYDSSYA